MILIVTIAEGKYALKSDIPDDYTTVDDLNQYAEKTYSYSKSEADSRFFLQTEFPDDYITNTDLAEFAKTVDHYTKIESDKKYREKNDLIYEETEDIPFTQRRDENDIFEVKILMTRLTRLVGTICGQDGVVKNFEILFDFDVNHQNDPDIEWGVEIDGQNYYADYSKVADDDWRFFISNDLENFDTVLHKAEKILKKDDIPLKADLYTKEEADTKYAKTEEKIIDYVENNFAHPEEIGEYTYSKEEADTKYREKNDLIYEETEYVPFEHRRYSDNSYDVKIKMVRPTRLVGEICGQDGVVKKFETLFDLNVNHQTDTDFEWDVEINGIFYRANYTKVAEDDWHFYIYKDEENFNTYLRKAEKIVRKDEFAMKADHYTKTESDKKYREKNDLRYEETEAVPFEHRRSANDNIEVKIKMGRLTRLVGTMRVLSRKG